MRPFSKGLTGNRQALVAFRRSKYTGGTRAGVPVAGGIRMSPRTASPMKRGLAAAVLTLAAAVLTLAAAGAATAQGGPTAPADVQRMYETLMQATVQNKVEDFHRVCHEDVRAAVTPETLAEVSKAVQPVLGPGYGSDYLGRYRKGGMDVHLYRVDPDRSDDDLLVILAVRGARCAGFMMR